MNVEQACEAGRSHVYEGVERFSLRKIRALAGKGVTQGVAHKAFPVCFSDHYDDFSCLSADVREKDLLLGLLVA